MLVLDVKDIIYRNGILSQDNGWKTIREYLEDKGYVGEGKEDVMLDFKNISVTEPRKHNNFKLLLKYDNLYMTFYNIESDVAQIKIECILNKYNKERFTNIDIKKDKKVPMQELKIINGAKSVMDKFEFDGDKLIFNMSKHYSQMNNGMTVMYITRAAETIIDSKNGEIKSMLIILGSIASNSSTVELMVKSSISIEKKYGITVDFDVDNPDVEKLFNLHMHVKTVGESNDSDRLNAFSKLSDDEVGILIKYKNGRAVDEFGRLGHGEVVSSRVAIYKGTVSTDDEGIKVLFQSFNSNKLYTKQHWAIENDGEELSELDFSEVSVKISDIGLEDLFLGRQYHFIKPIQRDINENISLYSLDDDKLIRNSVTIPERARLVFDDFGIQYNREELEKAIRITAVNLGISSNYVNN